MMIIYLLLCLTLTSCSSVIVTTDNYFPGCGSTIYGSTRLDAHLIVHAEGPGRILAAIDIIPCTLLDTVFLVYTIPHETTKDHEQESCYGGF